MQIARGGGQYVFPSPVRSVDPRPDAATGTQLERRRHVYPESVQRAVREAAKLTPIDKPVSPHVLRHSLRTYLPRTCCRRAMTFARCKSCWAMRM